MYAGVRSVRAAERREEVLDRPDLVFSPTWSRDSKNILFATQRDRIKPAR